MQGIFLDDERNPEDVTWISYPAEIQWNVVRNFSDFVHAVDSLVMTSHPVMISFDHDLGDVPFSGMTCMKHLVQSIEHCMLVDGVDLSPDITIRVHSQNPIGAKNIQAFWNSYRRSLLQS